MEIIVEPLKRTFDEMALKLLVFAIIIMAAYSIPYLLLSFIKLPHTVKHFVSVLACLGAFYFSFAKIFT